jgi:hypothetical protein
MTYAESTQYQYKGTWYSKRELETLCNTLTPRIIADIKLYGICYGKDEYYMVHDGKTFRIVKMQSSIKGDYVRVNRIAYYI